MRNYGFHKVANHYSNWLAASYLTKEQEITGRARKLIMRKI